MLLWAVFPPQAWCVGVPKAVTRSDILAFSLSLTDGGMQGLSSLSVGVDIKVDIFVSNETYMSHEPNQTQYA